MQSTLLTPPKLEPIKVDEVSEHASADDDHATYIASLIPRARQLFESQTGRLMVQQTWRFNLPKFANCIELPKTPLQSILSVKYLDNLGQLVTLNASQYRVVNNGTTAQLMPALGTTWPAPGYKVPDAVQIEAVFGHAPTTESPLAIDVQNISESGKYELAKQALFILIADWFRNREASAAVQLYAVPNSFTAICDELKVDVL